MGASAWPGGISAAGHVAAAIASRREAEQTPLTAKALQEAIREGQHVSIGEERHAEAIERALKAAQGAPTSLQYAVDDKTKQFVVRVMNDETGKIIREITLDKPFELIASRTAKAGIWLDERV